MFFYSWIEFNDDLETLHPHSSYAFSTRRGYFSVLITLLPYDDLKQMEEMSFNILCDNMKRPTTIKAIKDRLETLQKKKDDIVNLFSIEGLAKFFWEMPFVFYNWRMDNNHLRYAYRDKPKEVEPQDPDYWFDYDPDECESHRYAMHFFYCNYYSALSFFKCVHFFAQDALRAKSLINNDGTPNKSGFDQMLSWMDISRLNIDTENPKCLYFDSFTSAFAVEQQYFADHNLHLRKCAECRAWFVDKYEFADKCLTHRTKTDINRWYRKAHEKKLSLPEQIFKNHHREYQAWLKDQSKQMKEKNVDAKTQEYFQQEIQSILSIWVKEKQELLAHILCEIQDNHGFLPEKYTKRYLHELFMPPNVFQRGPKYASYKYDDSKFFDEETRANKKTIQKKKKTT